MTTAFEFLLWLLAVFVHFFFLVWIPTGPSGSGVNLHEWIGWLGSSVIVVVTWGRVDLGNESWCAMLVGLLVWSLAVVTGLWLLLYYSAE